jgi:hypothetical protein
MLELIGYIVACKGSEDAVARVTVGTSKIVAYAGANFVSTATGAADFQ